MVSDVEVPGLGRGSRQAKVFVGVVLRTGLHDDCGAVLARAKMAEVASVREAFDGAAVAVLSLVLGHQRRRGWPAAGDFGRGRCARSSETDEPRTCSSA